MTPKDVNYEQWADTFADLLQEFVWIHAGSDNGVGLQVAFKDSLGALLEYRKAFLPVEEKSLKQIINEAYWNGLTEPGDPWGPVLNAIANEAHRWTKYSTDDQETTEDIKNWLRAEASK